MAGWKRGASDPWPGTGGRGMVARGNVKYEQRHLKVVSILSAERIKGTASPASQLLSTIPKTSPEAWLSTITYLLDRFAHHGYRSKGGRERA